MVSESFRQHRPRSAVSSILTLWQDRVRTIQLNWLIPVGFAGLAVLTAATIYALAHGDAPDEIAVGTVLSCFVGLVGFSLVASRIDARILTASLIAAAAMGTFLEWRVPEGLAFLGLYVLIVIAAVRLSMSKALIVWLVCAAAIVIADLASTDVTPRSDVLINLGAIFLFAAAIATRLAIEGRRRAERDLAVAEASRKLEARTATLRERERLAREMHDVLAHSLSGLAIQLESLRLTATDRRVDAEIVDQIQTAHSIARAGLGEAYDAIRALRGDTYDLQSIERFVGEFGNSTGTRCAFSVAEGLELDPETSLVAFRCVQEALTNVRRHAPGHDVDVRIEGDASHVDLTVADFGADPATPTRSPSRSGGYGLAGMRERAELAGGSLVAGPTSTGFRVELRLPRSSDVVSGPARSTERSDV